MARLLLAACLSVLASGVGSVTTTQEAIVVRPSSPLPPLPWEGVPKEFQFLFGLSDSGGWAQLPFDSISLERTSCYGDCPAYTVTFLRANPSGTAPESYQDHLGRAELRATRVIRADNQYRGRFPEAVGEFTGWVDLYTFGRLSYLIHRSDFASFQDRYPVGMAISDASSAKMTVVGRGTTKSVVVTGGRGPIELWAIEEAVDSAAKSVRWNRK